MVLEDTLTLADWLKQQNMTQAAFAELIDSDQGHVSDLVSGKISLPRPQSIQVIAEKTKGQVTAADWINQISQKASGPVRFQKLAKAHRAARKAGR